MGGKAEAGPEKHPAVNSVHAETQRDDCIASQNGPFGLFAEYPGSLHSHTLASRPGLFNVFKERTT
jgi:hypothetical protein